MEESMPYYHHVFMCVAAGLLASNVIADDCHDYADTNEWRPVEYKLDIVPDSVLDFSKLGLQDAPAGRHGRVIVANGKFVFEARENIPQRFYGANLCFTANYLDKAACDTLADRFAAIGYNSVRIHHHDDMLASSQSGTVLDKENLDKLDYLFAAMKKRGIYITTDLFVSRKPRPGELPGVGKENFKGLMAVSSSAFDNLMSFSQAWMEHVNPYTGISWKDDPALCFIGIVNENTVYHYLKKNKIKESYLALFEQFLKTKKITPANEQERTEHFNDFIIEYTINNYNNMAARLKNMGVKTPLSDQNMWMTVPLSLIREHCDYVDTHGYWDHPQFIGKGWKLPMRFKGISSMAIELTGEEATRKPARQFPARIFGKPFVSSEVNFCFPNPYRAEYGALVGAYAALQDWDGVYKFAYSHSSGRIKDGGRIDIFDVSNDPIQLLAEKLAILLFLRGDVKASDIKISLIIDAGKKIVETGLNEAEHSNSHVFTGFVGQLGCVIRKNGKLNLPEGTKISFEAQKPDTNKEVALAMEKNGALGNGALNMDEKSARSSTAELKLNGKQQYFIVSTQKTEAVVTVNNGKFSSGSMTVDNHKNFASVSISSLDSMPIKDSRRMLFLHLTNAVNSNMKFKTPTIVEDFGSLPALARRGVADISICLSKGNEPEVYGVDLTGKRLGRIKTRFSKDGTLSFTSDTFIFEQPCFVYEIIR